MILNYTLYVITNRINNKKYVGVTNRSASIRFNEHMTHDTGLLYKARKKYGRNNFKIEIIKENIPFEQISSLEKEYILKYNSLIPYGYNLSTGGIENKNISKEGKERLKEINTGLGNPMSKGRIAQIDPLTDEVIEVYDGIRDAARKLFNDSEKKANIAICLKGKTKKAYGYKWRYV